MFRKNKHICSMNIDQKEMEKYVNIGQENSQKCNEVLKSKDSFTESSTNLVTYEIDGQSVTIPITISYKKKTKPQLWLAELIVPANNKLVQEMLVSNERAAWDSSSFSSFERVNINNNANPNLFVIKYATPPKAGGAISSRDFVELHFVEEASADTITSCATSIQTDAYKPTKGCVRGCTIMSAFTLEKMDAKDLEEKYNVPQVKTSLGKLCEWTKLAYIAQKDIKGWIPSSVVNKSFEKSILAAYTNLLDTIVTKI
eukprot:667908_1